MKKKTEKQRFDLDKDFFIGFVAGVGANILAQYLYDLWLADKVKEQKAKLTGLESSYKATGHEWSTGKYHKGTIYGPSNFLMDGAKKIFKWLF